MVELEKGASARVRRGGQRAERVTGEIVAAAFRHDASRALDPQLHTHLVVFNCTYDPVEQAWRALEPERMFAQSRYLTEVYRNELAVRLTALGYRLRTTAHGFEIEGVSEAVIRRFSKRRQAIEQAEAKLAGKLGRKLSNNGRAAVAHATRARKRPNLDGAELVAQQRAQLSAAELAALERLVVRGAVVPPPAKSHAADELVQLACEHLFERRSVVSEHEVLEQALRFGRGAVVLDELRHALAVAPGLVRKKSELTTAAAIRQEKQLIDLVNASIGSCSALHRAFQAAASLSAEQRQVVETILSSTDGVVALRGGAGTGKTFTLRELARGLETRKQTVQLLAPTAGAVEVLRREGFQGADTVQRFVVDPGLQEQVRGQVLIVDEAGLLSVRQMLDLVERCRSLGCRLVLSGDARQHTSVEAGDALRLLETRSHLQTARLNRIVRQTRAEYREAIQDLAEGRPQRALARLERLGAVAEIEGRERYERLATDYVASLKAGKSALIVAPTWREIGRVSEQVRATLKESGRLPQREADLEIHVPAGWTAAQKRDVGGYAPGQVLMFHGATKDFQRGEWGRVVEVAGRQLKVQKSGGPIVTVTRKQAGCFDVATSERLGVAQGERLLLRASRRDAGLLNGQVVTVKSVRRDGRIKLTDGRMMPADFKLFTHGYCVTSPAAQGKTADHVYVAMDAASGQAANLKQFYVSASRGRERVQIYTDDREALREAVGRSGNRVSAGEWTQRAAQEQSEAPRVRVRPH